MKNRDRSFSFGANGLPPANGKNLVSGFLSTPNNIHSLDIDNSTQNINKRHISVQQILAYSAENFSGSGLLLEKISDSSKPTINSDTAERPEKKASFNWRLAYHPRCLAVGFASLAYNSGFAGILQCVPPLGKQCGKKSCSLLLHL